MTGEASRAATAIVLLSAWFVSGAEPRAHAQGQKQTGRAAGAPTTAEFTALKQQVERQQELIMRLTQMEGEHYEFLVKLFQNGKGEPSPPPPPSGGRASGTRTAPAAATETAGAEAPAGHRSGAGAAGTITGRVEVDGKAVGPVYVYVDNLKAPLVHNRAIQIAQTNKTFVPGTVLVQRGTKVTFPNFDLVLHNTFSPSPTQPFDLGSYRQGDKAGTVTMTNPGVVEVFCNMHANMRANVLVVPNGFHTTVEANGTFTLENVPIGSRRLVAWTPDARPATQVVELTSAGASAKLALKVEAPAAHNKKDNTPYSNTVYPGARN